MKGLKKLALVTAVAAAPFAQAEMTAMDDALLGEMTGQAGITIDVDLAMTIDAIKYVDRDGNQDGSGVQGAITMKGLTIGSIQGDGSLEAARIRGLTIDADGTDGLVIGINEIGDDLGNGIDVTVDAVMINDGSANLHMVETAAVVSFVDQGTGIAGTLNVGEVKAAVPVLVNDATVKGGAAQAAGADYATAQATAAATRDSVAQTNFGANYADLSAADQATVDADASVTAADADVASTGAAAATASTDYNNANDELNKALAVVAPAGAGNIGGFKVTNFRNYIQDTLVEEYNGVFDMALNDSNGNLNAGSTGGRFVRGEIVIQGTGNYVTGTSGLKISGQFGGAMDEAAWVDEGQEFGIQDLGFFHGVDTDGDTIADTIEGMHFEMEINVVDHASWNGGGAIDVAALEISGLKMQGTIMMGSLYLDSTTAGVTRQSLGSVLVKDIDMTGTSVYVYGH